MDALDYKVYRKPGKPKTPEQKEAAKNWHYSDMVGDQDRAKSAARKFEAERRRQRRSLGLC